MKNANKFIIFILTLAMLASLVTACSPRKDEPEATGTTQYNLTPVTTPVNLSLEELKEFLSTNFADMRIDGSTSLIPLHQALGASFVGINEEEGYEEYYVNHSKTVDAFNLLLDGERDILLCVDYSDELLATAQERGVKLERLPITREAFVFLINSENSVTDLSQAQLRDIYSGKSTNWAQLGGSDAPIKAFQRNSDSGSQMRMVKFMGAAPLIEKDVEYIQSMGPVIERISEFDSGRYSIAYNMYTFTEKQYMNEKVALLAVDGVAPTDQTIFDESYPLVIYNYVYYDANKPANREFAHNLHAYLMSDEGQKLIADTGYVNLNKFLDRKIKDNWYPWDYNYDDAPFYNSETGKYISYKYVDQANGFENVVAPVEHDTFADYFIALNKEYHTGFFKFFKDKKLKTDTKNLREYLNWLHDLGIAPKLRWGITFYKDSEYGYVVSMNIQREYMGDYDLTLFSFRYNGKHYQNLKYIVDNDSFVLTAMDSETYNYYTSDYNLSAEYSAKFQKYPIVPDERVELTREELKNVEMQVLDDEFLDENEELIFFKAFEE
ncbi:MAG: substrate-binding domain-containing protein [Oscillospiraceae bacterium]|nr:substrate-binding domain-containing protein [Oscillospiraceae bacterium]